MEFPLEHLTTWNGMRSAGKYRVVVAFDGNGDTLYVFLFPSLFESEYEGFDEADGV